MVRKRRKTIYNQVCIGDLTFEQPEIRRDKACKNFAADLLCVYRGRGYGVPAIRNPANRCRELHSSLLRIRRSPFFRNTHKTAASAKKGLDVASKNSALFYALAFWRAQVPFPADATFGSRLLVPVLL